VAGLLAGWLSSFTLSLALDNSARTAVAILAESTLYRAAVCARFEFFSSSCLGLYPGQYRSVTRGADNEKTMKVCGGHFLYDARRNLLVVHNLSAP